MKTTNIEKISSQRRKKKTAACFENNRLANKSIAFAPVPNFLFLPEKGPVLKLLLLFEKVHLDYWRLFLLFFFTIFFLHLEEKYTSKSGKLRLPILSLFTHTIYSSRTLHVKEIIDPPPPNVSLIWIQSTPQNHFIACPAHCGPADRQAADIVGRQSIHQLSSILNLFR